MKKVLALVLTAVLGIGLLAGCGGSSSGGSSSGGDSSSASSGSEASSDAGYDLYIFNTKGENADALQAAVDAFSAEKGVTVKVFSLGSGTNSDDTLRTEMASKNKPGIFCCMNAMALVEWVEGGYAMDLSKATNEEFKKMVSEIPENFYLTQDGVTNYGVPFNVEGYGYIVDKDMLSDLFGADNVDAWIEAYKTASYDEWEAMVDVLAAYIKDGTAGTVTLSGQTFDLAAEKTGLAANLEGVFSVAGSEKWTYGDHLINVAIDAIFKDSKAASEATAEQLEAGKANVEAYARTLDKISANATTARGPELINSSVNGYDQQVQNFANGKAIFVKQGNWVYTNLMNANPDVCDNLAFIPIKMPFNDADIKSGLTAEHMNTSIPVFVPNYYLINDKVSDAEKELAQEFLVWLNTTEAGQKFVVEDMAFIPYNADPATTDAGYSLGNSIIEYIAAGKTITNAYAGAPSGWSGDIFGAYIMENYLNQPEWPANAYEDIANYFVSSWCEQAGL